MEMSSSAPKLPVIREGKPSRSQARTQANKNYSLRPTQRVTVPSSTDQFAATAPATSGSPAAASIMKQELVTVSEAWRSRLLRSETRLREMATTQGVSALPSLANIFAVMEELDVVIDESSQQSSLLAELLRLLRFELCRAIFLNTDENEHLLEQIASAPASGMPWSEVAAHGEKHCVNMTYFDMTERLQRENVMLRLELGDGNQTEQAWHLAQQVEQLRDQTDMLSGEVDRLERQNESLAEECVKLREECDELRAQNQAQSSAANREIQALNVENKDMQLQLFRLRKQIADNKASVLKDSYRHLRGTKMTLMRTIFSDGDERLALLVLLSQIEGRLNEALDTYDNDYILSSESSHMKLQQDMVTCVAVLLEEMHHCEVGYRRLAPRSSQLLVSATEKETEPVRAPSRKVSNVAPPPLVKRKSQRGVTRVSSAAGYGGELHQEDDTIDETDGYVAVLFDSKIYEALKARRALIARMEDLATRIPNPPSHTAFGKAFPGAKKEEEGPFPGSPRHSGFFGFESPQRMSTLAFAPAASTTGPEAPPPAIKKKVSLLSTTDAGMVRRVGGWHAAQAKEEAPSRRRTIDGAVLSDGEESTGAVPGELKLAPGAPAEDWVTAKKQAWVDNILGATGLEDVFATAGMTFADPASPTSASAQQQVHAVAARAIPADVLMPRLLQHPMEELTATKFHTTVELFGGRDPLQQKMLCRLQHVDPSLPIQVPSQTNYVKLKFATADHSITSAPPGTQKKKSTTPAGLVDDAEEGQAGSTTVYTANERLTLFRELGSPTLIPAQWGLRHTAGAVSSTTASTVAFRRLAPLSPNRGPEWALYRKLFGGYRSLTPRMIEVTTLDHIMLRASERYYARMEYRYAQCLEEAGKRCPNLQLQYSMAETVFKDAYELTDFQEAIVDELEARYAFPELVGKTLYEVLCYLDAVAAKDPLLAAYQAVIRGFVPPTTTHYVSYMLYHLSYCWPSAEPTREVQREDVLTVLEYLYRNSGHVLRVDAEQLLSDYDTATRSAPFTFISVRTYLSNAMLNQEEPLLLYLQSLFGQQAHAAKEHPQGRGKAGDANIDAFGSYEKVINAHWKERDEQRSMVRFLVTLLGFKRPSAPSVTDLAYLASSAWCSNLWE